MGDLADEEELDEAPRALVAGRYRLESIIGSGGMAEVWAATDVRLARPVALKFLTLRGPDEGDDQAHQRFLREARIAASVRHPNVVDVLDFGADREGCPYMVMERLHGESLEERLARVGSLELEELLQIALDVLTGLDVVHRTGIVHRDLKPANVFLLEDADPVHVKLIDFGVSRATEAGSRRSVLTTMHGRLVGTPAYMSSEQARGWSNIDRRADLYGLGAILYEGITGRLPYQEEATGDLIIAIAAGGAPTVAELRPEVGEAISSVIERAMKVDRDERYQSAIEMRAALVAAAASLGRDVRPSLPMPALARQVAGAPAPGSDIATIDVVPQLASLARPANGTPRFAAPRTGGGRLGLWAAAAVTLATIVGGSWVWLGAPDPEPSPGLAMPPAEAPPRASEPRPAAPAVARELDSGAHVMPPGPIGVEPRPATVRLSLRGLPARARVFVDGERAEVTDGVLELPRDNEVHVIEVRVRGRRWRARHVADEDATLRVRMTRPRARRPAPSAGVFRELDY